MGALTSKPFSFTARSWELIDRVTHDHNDTFFSSIKVSFRGNKVIRILPEFNLNNISEWISDRTRFSYDSLSNDFSYDTVIGSRFTFTVAWVSFFFKRSNISTYFFQPQFDISTTFRLKNITSFTGFSFISTNTYDFRKLFFTNFQMLNSTIYNYKFFYFIGLNFRYNLPVFSINFRKLNFSNEQIIINIGFFTNNLLNDINFGFSTDRIINFFRSSSRLSKFFFNNSQNSIIFSLPHFGEYIFLCTRKYILPEQIYFFYSKPFYLSKAEIFFRNNQSNFSNTLKFSFPHPFNYVSYQIKEVAYQKIDSLFSSFFYGNYTILFDKKFSNDNIYYFSSFNKYFYISFSFNNFYTHFFNNSFNKTSLNILLSVRRQQDLRSSFYYYNLYF